MYDIDTELLRLVGRVKITASTVFSMKKGYYFENNSLIKAITENNYDKVIELLSGGINIDIYMTDKFTKLTVLHVALYTIKTCQNYNIYKIIKLLLEKDAYCCIYIRDINGFTPLDLLNELIVESDDINLLELKDLLKVYRCKLLEEEGVSL